MRFLLVMAAARGVIDFRRARPLDPSWRRHCRVLLMAFEADMDSDSLRTAHRHALALVGNPALTKESFEQAQEAAAGCRQALFELRRPWERKAQGEGYATLREMYVRLVGDPSSPDFRRREAEALERHRRERAGDRRKVDNDAELRRRLQARG